MEIQWSDLGSPTRAGDVEIDGLGIVQVTHRSIMIAAMHRGDVSFPLKEAGAHLKGPQRFNLVLPAA